ncbi:serine hydrolase domain-containing protein [Sinisalibacter lacisalsi]|uniref:Beta-lactamase-related domain-containing protein n=1 Tax=Sinisalibacter lacisalsi TaxID=1526570 RepID=A0ABQ1QJD3_9RHOB|nr:serine hydrolase domain-containing protein [Sinisalibacter lacisalsi]GGD29850.1 hypothetical protein GCM10011358_12330 [Sinisalibacter lacisalsi]
MIRFAVLALLLPVLAHADEIASVQYLEADGTVSIAVEGGASPDTPFAIASIGKTMTAVAVLRLVADGKLTLDGGFTAHLPDEVLSGLPELSDVTLRHLLTMTSGLPDYLDDAYIEDALEDPGAVQNPLTALSYAYGETQLFPPGQGFDYSNTNYVLLGLILEEVTGATYAAAMDRLVIGPAGMTGSFVFGSAPLPDSIPNGHEDGKHYRAYYMSQGFGDGGVIASANDLARFYHALFLERSLLPRAMMREFLHDPHDEGYGMGIEVDDEIVGHSGGDLGFSSDVRLDLDSGALAIMLSASADADTDWTFDALAR